MVQCELVNAPVAPDNDVIFDVIWIDLMRFRLPIGSILCQIQMTSALFKCTKQARVNRLDCHRLPCLSSSINWLAMFDIRRWHHHHPHHQSTTACNDVNNPERIGVPPPLLLIH